jgi:hypothetical protein
MSTTASVALSASVSRCTPPLRQGTKAL